MIFEGTWKTSFSIFKKRNISSLPSDTDINHLVSKASGQFIYASTVDYSPSEQLDIVLKLRPASPPSPYAQLDKPYIQILSQQPDVRSLRDISVIIIALGDPSFCESAKRSYSSQIRKSQRIIFPCTTSSGTRSVLLISHTSDASKSGTAAKKDPPNCETMGNLSEKIRVL